ncbi:uncharacterized protein LOC132306676 [Cornus florida]|uniref:uncharacterized protein LOC132306676 n=1 Tax=Cornus florida TaxID=4283 RepID=UPI0028A1619F|nr:uncharacterized protein LOC132306676 [Cornus florida]XP_059660157.1 uncharacterized protein LOC132306676 [Cornus florida]XP_059660158.1 uncharacterized protein LOC132306676 [Cornus florida]
MGKKGEGSKQFRWTKPMERMLLNILADEVNRGNRPNNRFKVTSFNRVANAVAEHYGVECSSDHVEHRLRTVKNVWSTIEQLREKSEFGWDENVKMVVASPTAYDEHIQLNPSHEKYLNKKIEMYDEISLVVGKDKTKGNFAKSLANVNLEARPVVELVPLDDSLGTEEASMDEDIGKRVSSSSTTPSQSRQHGKRSRTSYETDLLESISAKLGEVAAALSKLTDNGFDINKLYQEVMKTGGFDEEFLATAFDYLVQHEMLSKAFLVKNDRLRKLWLKKFQKEAH